MMSGLKPGEIAELYGFRWNSELDIRSIKTSLNLNHVRCKSPEMVHREVWTTILGYNLIRTMLRQIANCEVANRPGRLEPRVLKRRRHGYDLMKKPRHVLKAELRKHCT